MSLSIFGETKVHNILTLTTNKWFKNDTLKEQKKSHNSSHTLKNIPKFGWEVTRACLLVFAEMTLDTCFKVKPYFKLERCSFILQAYILFSFCFVYCLCKIKTFSWRGCFSTHLNDVLKNECIIITYFFLLLFPTKQFTSSRFHSNVPSFKHSNHRQVGERFMIFVFIWSGLIWQ